MNMNKLEFLRTLTVQEFKEEKNTSILEVKENPKKPGSFFMVNSAGSVIGAVSKKILTEGLDKPVVSEVSDTTGHHFYLLHNKGEGGKVIATF